MNNENIKGLKVKYNRLCGLFETKYGKMPSLDETAHYLGIHKEKVALLMEAMKTDNITSLDILRYGENETLSIMDTVSDGRDYENDIIECVIDEEIKAKLWECVDNLEPEQSHIIRNVYKENMNRSEAGRACGLSHSQTEKPIVRQC